MDFKSVLEMIDDKKYDELDQFNLPGYFRSTMTRDEKELNLLSKIVEIYISNPAVKTEIICLKTLINSCCVLGQKQMEKTLPIESEEYENYYFMYETAIKFATNKVLNLAKNEVPEENELTVLKLHLKLVCNFITMLCQTETNPHYEAVPKYLKSEDFKENIISLISNTSEEIATISCIYCYHALTVLIDKNYFNLTENIKLYKNFLHVYSKVGCSAAEEGILYIIKVPNIFQNLYDYSEFEEKRILIDIIKKNVGEQNEEEEKRFQISNEIMLSLIQRFNQISDKVTLTNNIKNLQDEEPEELAILLKLCLYVCTNDSKILEFVQKNKSFLINCISLLKMLHINGKQPESDFSPMNYTAEILMASRCSGENTMKNYGELNSIVYGFKSRLIRMIGSLSNLNQHNQNLVRDLDGLSVIMDCCTWDAKNPFIKESSIFAIKTLCEGNSENQNQIGKMVQLETDNTKILEKMGLTLQKNEDGSGIRIAEIKRNQS